MRQLIERLKTLIFHAKEEAITNTPELRYPTKATSVRDTLGDTYEYSKMPSIEVSEECKEIVIWFDREAVAAYKHVMGAYFKYADKRDIVKNPIAELEKYVYAWSDGKVVTQEDIGRLEKCIDESSSWIQSRNTESMGKIDYFYEKNAIDVLVDSRHMKLYEFTTMVPYHRIYALFFKKANIPQRRPLDMIRNDVEILDRILVLLDLLYEGWGKTGADTEFTEMYRRRQQDLMTLIHQYVDAIEKDIATLEAFKQVSRTLLNINIYPVHPE